jgi:hypothetical protein
MAAARQLLAEIGGAAAGVAIVVPSVLVVRESSRHRADSADHDPESENLLLEDAYNRLTAQDTVLGFNRAMHACTKLEQVFDELLARMEELGIIRCFVVVFEEVSDPQGDGPGELARLVLHYRHGRSYATSSATFPARELLPESLQKEAAVGTLVMQPLTAREHEFGYVLFEWVRKPVNVSEVLHRDLSRTLEAIFTNQRLHNHAAQLEELVRRRTQELASEVATRRRAEDELQRANEELHRLLLRDALTKISNRAAFDSHLAYHWQYQRDVRGEVSLVMVDIDFFKTYNDLYGHVAGSLPLTEGR